MNRKANYFTNRIDCNREFGMYVDYTHRRRRSACISAEGLFQAAAVRPPVARPSSAVPCGLAGHHRPAFYLEDCSASMQYEHNTTSCQQFNSVETVDWEYILIWIWVAKNLDADDFWGEFLSVNNKNLKCVYCIASIWYLAWTRDDTGRRTDGWSKDIVNNPITIIVPKRLDFGFDCAVFYVPANTV